MDLLQYPGYLFPFPISTLSYWSPNNPQPPISFHLDPFSWHQDLYGRGEKMTKTSGFDELRAQRGKNPAGSHWLALLGVGSAKKCPDPPWKEGFWSGKGTKPRANPENCVKYPKITSVEVLRLPWGWWRAQEPGPPSAWYQPFSFQTHFLVLPSYFNGKCILWQDLTKSIYPVLYQLSCHIYHPRIWVHSAQPQTSASLFFFPSQSPQEKKNEMSATVFLF